QQTEQEPREVDLGSGSRSGEQHLPERRPFPFLQHPALLVELNRQKWRHDHESRERREEDVVESERDQQPHEDQRNEEYQKAVADAEAGLDEQVAPARTKPPKADGYRQVPLPSLASGLVDSRRLAEQPV